MPRTAPVTVKISDMPEVKAEIKAAIRDGIKQAIAAERRRFLALVGASCACQSCKNGITDLLADTPCPDCDGEGHYADMTICTSCLGEGTLPPSSAA